MMKIAITGGIGSGKTYVSSILESMNVPVYNSDDNSKKLVESDIELRNSLVSILGEECYIDDRLNKKMLADFIFSSQGNRLLINSIIHPCVYRDFLKWCDIHKDSKIVAIESAILFEAGFDKYVDKVLMVSAPLETRIERAMQRDNATREMVLSRISAQMDDEKKCNLSDFIVSNDGVADLKPQLMDIIGKLNV